MTKAEVIGLYKQITGRSDDGIYYLTQGQKFLESMLRTHITKASESGVYTPGGYDTTHFISIDDVKLEVNSTIQNLIRIDRSAKDVVFSEFPYAYYVDSYKPFNTVRDAGFKIVAVPEPKESAVIHIEGILRAEDFAILGNDEKNIWTEHYPYLLAKAGAYQMALIYDNPAKSRMQLDNLMLEIQQLNKEDTALDYDGASLFMGG